jgi:hypothetical protein
MASSEIVVTVGADSTQLEKGLKDVTKEADKVGSEGTAKATSFAAILGRAYGYMSMIGSVVGQMFDGFMSVAKRAQELRNLSVSTGIPIDQLQRYEVVAKNAGISLATFAHSVAEFNKKMGEAKIRGSEANAAMTKLGFGLKDITNGSFTYNEALLALAAAHEAGTDSATLMHYGVQLFGSSFEQLLPIIKQGTLNIKKQMDDVLVSKENLARRAANAADTVERTSSKISNGLTNIVGLFAQAGEDILDETYLTFQKFGGVVRKMGGGSNKDIAREYADSVLGQMSSGKSKKEQKEYLDYYSSGLDAESKKFFDERVKEVTDAKGKKLTPLGLSEAQGASTMQQMGGGDIVSAIAFTPLERIATATEETARNTAPENKTTTTETSNVSNIQLGF